ncbi:PREDICTED: protein FAM8A1 [Bactrocera latifrons]|uniref:protein FAM8A1 n=1 Tax=Bactrocera latifrons TaxID=174628 RepID=UPI0008DDB7B8|nr:PREDICTED: protein FAM8A1 [Bactrocera latifrons]
MASIDKKNDIKNEKKCEDANTTPVGSEVKQLEAEKEKLVASAPSAESDIGREMTTKEAYFASLNEWVKHANISQNAMALFPLYLIHSYPQMFQNLMNNPLAGLGGAIPPINAQAVPATPNLNAADANGFGERGRVLFQYRILSDQLQSELIHRTGGYEYVIAPFWKRVVAEIIDMVILLLLKIVVTFTVMNLFDLDLGFDLDKEVLRKAIEDDDYVNFLAVSMDFLAFSSDLLMLELLTKIIVCFYEAIWTAAYNGATPGKAAMKIRIQYVEAIYPLPPAVDMQPQPPPFARQFQGFQAQRMSINALIYPNEVPTFHRAFMRAVSKNLIMTLFFPMCFIMIFFKNNRTAYDIATKTIVVEANPNPTLRQPPPPQ